MDHLSVERYLSAVVDGLHGKLEDSRKSNKLLGIYKN